MDLTTLLDLQSIFGIELAAIIGLISFDVLMGVSAALRTGTFNFRELTNFYRTMVIPYLIGWLAFAAAASVIPDDAIGEFTFLFSDVSVHGAFIAVAASLVGSAIENIRIVYTGRFPWEEFPPVEPPEHEETVVQGFG